MKIDFHHRDRDPGLKARKIWEALYRLTDFGKAKSFDSFLCDLGSFERLININGLIEVRFYWQYDLPSGWTETSQYSLSTHNCYLIKVKPDEITIQKVGE